MTGRTGTPRQRIPDAACARRTDGFAGQDLIPGRLAAVSGGRGQVHPVFALTLRLGMRAALTGDAVRDFDRTGSGFLKTG